ncbi:hypothetical protein RAS1_05760 [Phycisphaerae bacterium RAS1]|nr:hypothetical protein RAS1_05760 [Phycisphaerae bacterium RAS1]
MLRTRRILLAFLVFLAAYGVLVASWPLWRNTGLRFLWQLGNQHMSRFGDAGRVHFGPYGETPRMVAIAATRPADSDDWRDTTVVLSNARLGQGAPKHMSLRNLVYAPMAVALALVFATPGDLLRRVILMLVSVGIAGGVGIARVWLALIEEFSRPHELAAYSFGAPLRTLIVVAHNALVQPPASIFVLPLFIWLLTAFRLRDWVRADESQSRQPLRPPAAPRR